MAEPGARSSTTLALACAILAVVAHGCSPNYGFALAITVELDSSVDDTALAQVKSFAFTATGSQSYSHQSELGHTAKRTERLLYYPAVTTNTVTVTITAQNASGAAIATGSSASLTLPPAKTTDVTIRLSATKLATDGGTDGATDGGVCTGFCDNFDDRDTLMGNWTSLMVNGAGSLSDGTISSAESVSPPHSAAFHSPAYAAGNGDGLELDVMSLPIIGNKVSYDFDVKITYAGGAGYINLVYFNADGEFTGGFTQVSNGVALDWAVLASDGSFSNPLQIVGIQDGQWHHVHYEEVFDSSAGSVYVTYDKDIVFAVGSAQTWALGTLPTTFGLTIGTLSTMQTGACDVYFDNIEAH